MIVDAHCHLYPKNTMKRGKKVSGRDSKLPSSNWARTVPTPIDLEARFKIMDEFEQMKSGYYELRGWDVDSGLPTGKKLSRLQPDDMAEDLEGRELLQ